MKRRGVTLIEVLVVGMVLVIIGGALLQAFISLNQAYGDLSSIPPVQSDAAGAVNQIAADIRKAALSDGSNGGTLNSAFVAANPSSLTIYSKSNGSTVQYQISNGALQRTAGGTTTTIASPNVTLNLSYCTLPTGYYYSPVDPSSLPWSSSISGSTLKNIVAVSISVVVARGAVASNYSSLVRLRNGPKKAYPFQ